MTDPTRWEALAREWDLKYFTVRGHATFLAEFAAAVEARTRTLTADEQRDVDEAKRWLDRSTSADEVIHNLLAIIDRLTKGAP